MHTRDNTAGVVLAGGYGSRLRPLTSNMPKALLLFQGKCLVDYSLEALRGGGILRNYVVLGYQADKVKQHLAGSVHRINGDAKDNVWYAISRATRPLVEDGIAAAAFFKWRCRGRTQFDLRCRWYVVG